MSFLRTIIVHVFFCTVLSHNWMHSQSRAAFSAQIIKPAPPKPLKKISHYQVARGQEFAVEFVTGHPGTHYYFVVLKSGDEKHLSRHSLGLWEKKLDDYIDNCPENNKLYKNDPNFKRRHVSYGSGGYGPVNGPTTTLPEQTGAPGERPQSELYKSSLFPGDKLYFKRPDVWENDGGRYKNKVQWEYKDEDLKRDAHCARTHPTFPYIISAHRYFITEPHRPEEWDIALLTINSEPGEYLIHMLWQGYRDAIDVDVLEGSTVADVYGKTGATVMLKLEHCQFPNWAIKHAHGGNCPIYSELNPDVAGFVAGTAQVGLNGVNVMPVFNPTCAIYLSKEKCEMRKCEWFENGNNGICRPLLQQSILQKWTSVKDPGHHQAPNANDLVRKTKNRIVRRLCSYCDPQYKELYYKRLVDDDFDFSLLWSENWTIDANEKLNQHFEIYSSLFDLLDGKNRWEFCADGRGEFPQKCGRYTEPRGQTNFHPFYSVLEEDIVERPIKNIYKGQKKSSCRTSFIQHLGFQGYSYFCGTQSEDGCWCDSECRNRGDCCDDYKEYCAGTPIGHQCKPANNECNPNADCSEMEAGKHYCTEKCREGSGRGNSFLCTTPTYDASRSEFLHFRNLGCWESDGAGNHLPDWVSHRDGNPEKSYTPRYCYLECKTRGYKYFSVAGAETGRCSCANSYGTTINPRTKQPFKEVESGCRMCEAGGDGQGGMEGCGVGWLDNVYEITECPYDFVHFGEDSKFESPNLCWKTDAGKTGADYCKDSCLPVAYQTKADANLYLQRCPGNICEYYRQENAIGDYFNGLFKDSAGCERSGLRDFVENRQEGIVYALGLNSRNPLGYHNSEVGDQYETVSDDPEDPIFYSTCFKKEVLRDFTNGVSYPDELPPPLGWKVGAHCLDCKALNDTILPAYNSQTRVAWWNTTATCQACNDNN